MVSRTKSDETHRKILQAAFNCFYRRGYNNTTMDEIAAESGTSKGTLYWHFESKDDLLESALRWFFESTLGPEALDQIGTIPTASDRLRILADSTVGFICQAEGIFNLFLEFWASSNNREQSANLWLDLLVEYRDVVIDVIKEGVERGEFRAVDAEAVAWAFMATYDGLAAYVMLKPDLDLARIHGAFIGTLLQGLVADT